MDLTVSTMKRHVRHAAMERMRGGPHTRRQNAELAAVVADLGRLAADLSASAAWTDIQLTRAVIEVQAARAEDLVDDHRATELALGRCAWWEPPSRTWDALLLVARRAVRREPALTARVVELLLEARPAEPEATALAAEAAAVLRTAERPRWRRRAAKRSSDDPIAVMLRERSVPAISDQDDWFGVEESLRAGDDLATAAGGALHASYLGEPGAVRGYGATLRATVARGLSIDAPLAPLLPILERTVAEPDAGGRPDLLGVRPMGLAGLREYLDGRSVCLVANSAELLDLELGAQIDSYDVVVRFNSFDLDPVRTGQRTDVHATIHLHDYNWDVPVDLRLVFGGIPEVWEESLRRHLRPSAQEFVGDESLRWPRNSLIGPELRDELAVPTTGFNMLVLLDYLDVCPRIDLFGFNFHSGDPYRRPDAMHLPVAAAHSYAIERRWVAERTVGTAPGRISLR